MSNGGRLGPLVLPNGASANGLWSLQDAVAFSAANRWPTDFPKTLSGLTLWLAAHRLTGLNDGDAVGTWPDLSGNGYDVTQATAGNKPLYKTNIFNGQPALLFDGTNSFMSNSASNPFTAGASRTVFVACKLLSSGVNTGSTFICFRTTARSWVCQQYVDASNPGLFFTDGTGNNNSISVNGLVFTFGIYCMRGTAGAPGKFRLNGGNGVAASGNIIAEAGTTGFFVGRRETTGGYMNGYIAEIIAYNSELSDANCLLVERYLNAKYSPLA